LSKSFSQKLEETFEEKLSMAIWVPVIRTIPEFTSKVCKERDI